MFIDLLNTSGYQSVVHNSNLNRTIRLDEGLTTELSNWPPMPRSTNATQFFTTYSLNVGTHPEEKYTSTIAATTRGYNLDSDGNSTGAEIDISIESPVEAIKIPEVNAPDGVVKIDFNTAGKRSNKISKTSTYDGLFASIEAGNPPTTINLGSNPLYLQYGAFTIPALGTVAQPSQQTSDGEDIYSPANNINPIQIGPIKSLAYIHDFNSIHLRCPFTADIDSQYIYITTMSNSSNLSLSGMTIGANCNLNSSDTIVIGSKFINSTIECDQSIVIDQGPVTIADTELISSTIHRHSSTTPKATIIESDIKADVFYNASDLINNSIIVNNYFYSNGAKISGNDIKSSKSVNRNNIYISSPTNISLNASQENPNGRVYKLRKSIPTSIGFGSVESLPIYETKSRNTDPEHPTNKYDLLIENTTIEQSKISCDSAKLQNAILFNTELTIGTGYLHTPTELTTYESVLNAKLLYGSSPSIGTIILKDNSILNLNISSNTPNQRPVIDFENRNSTINILNDFPDADSSINLGSINVLTRLSIRNNQGIINGTYVSGNINTNTITTDDCYLATNNGSLLGTTATITTNNNIPGGGHYATAQLNFIQGARNTTAETGVLDPRNNTIGIFYDNSQNDGVIKNPSFYNQSQNNNTGVRFLANFYNQSQNNANLKNISLSFNDSSISNASGPLENCDILISDVSKVYSNISYCTAEIVKTGEINNASTTNSVIELKEEAKMRSSIMNKNTITVMNTGSIFATRGKTNLITIRDNASIAVGSSFINFFVALPPSGDCSGPQDPSANPQRCVKDICEGCIDPPPACWNEDYNSDNGGSISFYDTSFNRGTLNTIQGDEGIGECKEIDGQAVFLAFSIDNITPANFNDFSRNYGNVTKCIFNDYSQAISPARLTACTTNNYFFTKNTSLIDCSFLGNSTIVDPTTIQNCVFRENSSLVVDQRAVVLDSCSFIDRGNLIIKLAGTFDVDYAQSMDIYVTGGITTTINFQKIESVNIDIKKNSTLNIMLDADYSPHGTINVDGEGTVTINTTNPTGVLNSLNIESLSTVRLLNVGLIGNINNAGLLISDNVRVTGLAVSNGGVAVEKTSASETLLCMSGPGLSVAEVADTTTIAQCSRVKKLYLSGKQPSCLNTQETTEQIRSIFGVKNSGWIDTNTLIPLWNKLNLTVC